jgi:tRNA threonylcarbamoyl adenosine modification protein YeaZ
MNDGVALSGCVLGLYTADGVAAAAVRGDRDAKVAASDGAGALESLLPCVRHVLTAVDCSLDDVTLVGVCTGPGSFTGLRIGVAFARSLAQARSLALVGISTYDAVEETATYPRISVARGKPGYYYARVVAAEHQAPLYLAGPRHAVEEAARQAGAPRVWGPDFSGHDPARAALRVARLARCVHESGASCAWADVAIDYGQRPQAVLQWEERHRVRAGGR